MVEHLVLMRHGQTTANVARLLETRHPGAQLTALGRRQAEAAAAVLTRRPVQAVFASTLARAQETAAPLAGRLGSPVQVLSGVHEIEAGDLEGLTFGEGMRSYRETWEGWIRGDLARARPGGPTGHDFLARFDASLDEVVASGMGTAVVVSHGAAIRCWTVLRAGIDPHWARANPLANTGTVALRPSASGWKVERWDPQPVGRRLLEGAAEAAR